MSTHPPAARRQNHNHLFFVADRTRELRKALKKTNLHPGLLAKTQRNPKHRALIMDSLIAMYDDIEAHYGEGSALRSTGRLEFDFDACVWRYLVRLPRQESCTCGGEVCARQVEIPARFNFGVSMEAKKLARVTMNDGPREKEQTGSMATCGAGEQHGEQDQDWQMVDENADAEDDAEEEPVVVSFAD